MRYEMQCGHIQELYPDMLSTGVLPTEFMFCQTCATYVRLAAIETREWRYSCAMCRYSRWSGQSQNVAADYGTVHYQNTGHDIGHTDYSRTSDLAMRVRQMYGQSVKLFIIDTTPRGIKPSETRQYIPEPLTLPDEPPF
jgi:hypothetical protein